MISMLIFIIAGSIGIAAKAGAEELAEDRKAEGRRQGRVDRSKIR
jgi:hypothetical protein